jgi:nucleotide-binding universal stress UspA family protein
LDGGAELACALEMDYEARDQANAYLQGLAKRIGQLGPAAPTTHLLDGAVAPALLSRARESNANLIVMTTHGRGAFSRFWLGSVADRMIRETPAPILLVKPPASPVQWEADYTVRRIVLALDGSHLSEQALAPTLELARRYGSAVDLTIVESPSELAGHFVAVGEATRFAQLREQANQRNREKLEALAHTHAKEAGGVTMTVLTHASPGQALVDRSSSGQTTGRSRWSAKAAMFRLTSRRRSAGSVARPSRSECHSAAVSCGTSARRRQQPAHPLPHSHWG